MYRGEKNNMLEKIKSQSIILSTALLTSPLLVHAEGEAPSYTGEDYMGWLRY